MSAEVGQKVRPRERILETARDLFHRNGIRAVGVDAIAEAAGTNKMTLYRHFGSKDDLVAECLRSVACEGDATWRDLEARYPGDRKGQLRGWIEHAAACVAADSRGCDLANAAVELTEPDHPARRVVEEFKKQHRDRLVALCREAGIAQPELLADALWLLVEGARVSRQSIGQNGPGDRFSALAQAVIAGFSRDN